MNLNKNTNLIVNQNPLNKNNISSIPYTPVDIGNTRNESNIVKTLYISNLPAFITRDKLYNFFENHGCKPVGCNISKGLIFLIIILLDIHCRLILILYIL